MGNPKDKIMKEKILIAYFVQKGKENNSACVKVADALGGLLKADGKEYSTFAITPTEEYPDDRENFELATKVEKEQRHRPELVGKYSGMKYVERILLVTPNWWNDLPMAVYSFLDTYDFAEKRIVPVVVHGGDGTDKATANLRDFLHKVWVLPAVGIADDQVGSPETQEQLKKAVAELFKPAVSK